MLRFIWLLLLISQVTFAQSSAVIGEGRFLAKDSDSLQFIKKQLIHEALKDVISKEIKQLNLNLELFWQKYNDSLDDSLKTVDESLKRRFGIGTDKENSKEVEKYTDALRSKRLSARLKFAGLNRVMTSYSIKRMSRSTQNPSSRFIKLEAKINRPYLSKIYYRFVQGKKSSEYGGLYINTEYELVNCSYSDLGVENEKDFTQVLGQHWLEWFSKNKPENLANIEILDEDKITQLKEFQAAPLEKQFEVVPEIFVNSLLLNVKIKIDLQNHSPILKEHQFHYSGNVYLQDLQTGKILMQGNIPLDSQKYSNVNSEEISSVIANYVYRMPLGQFTKLRSKIKNIPPLKLTRAITLFNYSNLKDVDSFIQLIEERGIKYSLSSKLISVGVNQSKVIVYFDGEISELKTLLDSVESAKKDLPFELIDSEDTLGIKFNKATNALDV